MHLDLRKIPDLFEVAFSGEEAWLSPIYETYGDKSKVSGSLKIHRQHRGEIYLVSGRIVFEPVVECARCCREIPWKINAQISTRLVARTSFASNKVNDFTLSSPELNEYEVDPRQPVFDLATVVNDAINDAIPSHIKCEDLDPQDPLLVCEIPGSYNHQKVQ